MTTNRIDSDMPAGKKPNPIVNAGYVIFVLMAIVAVIVALAKIAPLWQTVP